ncbi:hemerythrin domain-containing protein [Virgibacillus sp. MSJ-26]|uniref:hemerythrin domain-containing protein n=1 Tax=Virgibacillus sp. MSJ-26 TaxID=2841522 RepID=UPI001C1128A4|nr:hemerythrin domain-containing protein [Virgibacillus sp. MSJ-26]MBU5466651.1 hemerythrin domain-containing protein [Virgibacillus sp. MSJ-26]
MATGPALRKLAAHRSIHDGAHAEARDLTDVTEKLFQDNRMEDCLKAAEALIEYIESRIIAHADAEEEGLYQEIQEENPKLTTDIHMLTRDHDLMRVILSKIKEQLESKKEVTRTMINQFNAILIVNEIHSRSEEEKLLED